STPGKTITTTSSIRSRAPIRSTRRSLRRSSASSPTLSRPRSITRAPTPRGSYGLMQLSLQTARGLNFTGDPSGLLDPTTNVTLGTIFLATQVDRAGGDPATAAAFYN